MTQEKKSSPGPLAEKGSDLKNSGGSGQAAYQNQLQQRIRAWLNSRLLFFLLGAAFSFAVMSLVIFLRSESDIRSDEHLVPAEHALEGVQQKAQIREKVLETGTQEVKVPSVLDLGQSISQVDMALQQSLVKSGVDPLRMQQAGLGFMDPDLEQDIRHQTLVLEMDQQEQLDFLQFFREYKQDMLQQVQISGLAPGPGGVEISIQDMPTHRLLFEDYTPSAEPEPEPKLEPDLDKGRLALVIDDLGQSRIQAKRLADTFGQAVTLSILPFQAQSRETAQFGLEQNLDVMLHLPMEPEGYPGVDPGPGALFVNMEPELITEIIQENLEQVPGAIGANNHMGSRFSSDIKGMRTVLQKLDQNDMFYMDSLTTSNSRVRTLAQEISIPFLTRDIFIDNNQDVQAILDQLRKAEKVALQAGQAIAIGHPYPSTFEALEIWAEDIRDGVHLVKISDLVQEVN